MTENCGYVLKPNMKFCPNCGTIVRFMEADTISDRNDNAYQTAYRPSLGSMVVATPVKNWDVAG